MERVFSNGIKLVIPEGKEANIIFSSHIDGEDNISGIQVGKTLDLLVLSLNHIEEMLKTLPAPARKHYVVGIAEILADAAPNIEGMDVVMMKRSKHEEDDDE